MTSAVLLLNKRKPVGKIGQSLDRMISDPSVCLIKCLLSPSIKIWMYNNLKRSKTLKHMEKITLVIFSCFPS